MVEGWGEGVGSIRGIVLGWWSSVGIQLEGLQHVWSLVVRGWFLKWNCFFLIWVRLLAVLGRSCVWRPRCWDKVET